MGTVMGHFSASHTDTELLPLTTAHKLTLTPEALSGINNLLVVRKKLLLKLLRTSRALQTHQQRAIGFSMVVSLLQENTYNKFYKVNSYVIDVFQCLLKNTFPNVDGLQNTGFQDRTPLKCTIGNLTVQVLYVRNCHWATLAIESGHINL